LNLLAQVPDLKVIARTSSFAFKGQGVEIAEIARKLNVAHVLEGSVRTSGNTVRITAQLVRAADSTHLWSQKYDRPLDDIFAVQDEIANAVVSELKIKLLNAGPKAKERDAKAHALFLQARAVADQYTAVALDQAIALYKQALELDPSYAEAWDGLANIYGNQALDGLRPRGEGFRLATDAAQKALALDPKFAQAHARLGWIAIYYNPDLKSAAQHLTYALTLDSGNTEVIKMTVALLRRIDRLDLAIQFASHVLDHDPVNSDAHFDLGRAHYFSKNWDAAIAHYRTALALSPSSLGGRAVLGEALVLQGNPRAALEEIQIEGDDGWRLEVKSLALYALGESAASEAAWVQLADKYGQLFAISVAEAAAYRGDTDRAFQWLDKAAELRDPALGQIPFSPLCINLHKDPRWLPFLQKHGMAPQQLAAIKFDLALPN
jgi:adenylate cyclase